MKTAQNNGTNPVLSALQEWEANTAPHAKNHPVGKKFHVHEFRKFDEAIAWLEQDGNRIQITKLETLNPGRGAATRLVIFLKSLAEKHQVQLWGHARTYQPDPPVPNGHLLTKEQLEAFYKKHGFRLRKIDVNTSEMSYNPKL